VAFDGQSPPGVPQGTAGVAASKLRVAGGEGRAVVGVFNREGRFAVEARLDETVLMKGFHERAVVDMERFLAKLGVQPAK